MTKKFYILFSYLLVFSFLQIVCKDDPPPVVPPPPPSHPTITWIADTIKNPYQGAQLLLRSLWGSDINDVYAVGHNEAGGNASLYHFDGKKWSPVKVTWGEGGFINSYVSFSKIDGSGKNDVWAVGSRGSYYGSSVDSSLVIHFDGNTWKEFDMERCKHWMQGIKVISATEVYIGGTYGEIYRYDGVTFTKTVLDTNLAIVVGGSDDRMFAGCRTLNLSPNNYYCVYAKNKNDEWSLIIRTSEREYFQNKNYGINDFYPVGNGKCFVGGEGIFTITDTVWQTSYNKETFRILSIRGTSSTNIFAISPFNRLVHWNGIDWKAVNTPEGIEENKYLSSLWVKDNSIFILYQSSYDTNIIYRGTY